MDNKMAIIGKSFKENDMDNEIVSIAKSYKENKKQIKENKKQIEENIKLIKASKNLNVGKKQIKSIIKQIKANKKQIKEIEKNQEEILRNKANKKQIKEINKNPELLKNKEKFMNLKGYRIKVSEDSFILFEKEESYLEMFCLEKVFSNFYNDLFNEKEGIRLFFQLSVLGTYIKYLREIKIKVFYDEDECVNPLKVKFPNLTRGEDYEERVGIIFKIECLEIENTGRKNEFTPVCQSSKCVVNLEHQDCYLFAQRANVIQT